MLHFLTFIKKNMIILWFVFALTFSKGQNLALRCKKNVQMYKISNFEFMWNLFKV